ncbi:hypothetical protein [Clostridium botulinum]|uniref:hypothetical protein n=1 Tax=Clostridium botulinum TaxID=1491 RepID=UPI00174AA6FD|nr:hypothetical protein [Clostridium botulinum]MBD5589185.1 hypothetical protein [Clostridium botulinum]
MLRNLIASDFNSVEIYKIGEKVKRGAVLVKDYSGKVAKKADGVGIGIYLADFDYQPIGHLSNSEVSDYTEEADTIKENSLGLLIKPRIGETWASDEVDTKDLAVGDYLFASKGKLVKATAGQESILQFVGEYSDAGHKLSAFEVVEVHTVK